MGFLNNLFKNNKDNFADPKKTESSTIEPKKAEQIVSSPIKQDFLNPKKEIQFKVAGITYGNIQKNIKSFTKEYKESEDLYEGWTNKDILEMYSDGDKIFELDIYGYSEIELIPEPENIHDPNAIKVIHEDIGQVGYVPAGKCKQVKKALEEKYTLDWRLLGGKYKYIEYDDDKDKDVVKTDNYDYGIQITLSEP